MDFWEHMVANSTLAEADGDMWDHLTNPSGEGGGGDIIINSELVVVTEDSEITVVEISDKVDIIEDEVITLVEIDDIIILTIEEKENVDVVC